MRKGVALVEAPWVTLAWRDFWASQAPVNAKETARKGGVPLRHSGMPLDAGARETVEPPLWPLSSAV